MREFSPEETARFEAWKKYVQKCSQCSEATDGHGNVMMYTKDGGKIPRPWTHGEHVWKRSKVLCKGCARSRKAPTEGAKYPPRKEGQLADAWLWERLVELRWAYARETNKPAAISFDELVRVATAYRDHLLQSL
jgi:hypothetical protein